MTIKDDDNGLETGLISHLRHVFHAVPFNHMLGLHLHTLSHTEATIHFTMREEHIGNYIHGILHGGVISSVLDSAGGVVAMASIIHRHPNTKLGDLVNLVGKCSTIDLTINYLRVGRGESFTAKAYALKSGSKIAFMRMELWDENNELIATGTGTYLC